MAVGNIATAKELVPVSYQPLLLVEITFSDSTALYLSTHSLNVPDGGFQYNGHDYQPRLINTEQITTQVFSNSGIDEPSSVTLKVADPDGQLYQFYELGKGFKGAEVKVRFVFWNVGQNDFSSDSVVKFVGRCGSPSHDESTMTIPCAPRVNLTQIMLPPIRVQKTCSWNFPGTRQQRQEGKDNDYSAFFECGYSPDLPGGVGNWQKSSTLASSCTATDTSIHVADWTVFVNDSPYAVIESEIVLIQSANASTGILTVVRAQQGTTAASHSSGVAINTPFSSCPKDRGSCMQRLGNPSNTSLSPDGDIVHDKNNNHTGRFSGIQWTPPQASVSRGYITGKWEEIINTSNEAKYGDLVPFVYGTTFVNPLVLNSVGDANYTTFEILVCYGEVEYIYDVIINGVKIPHSYTDVLMPLVPGEMPGGAGSPDLKGGMWFTVNNGGRSGFVNPGAGYDSKGDCYGSLCVLGVVVPVSLAAANSVPSVQILLDGPKVRVYTDDSTFTRQFSSNPIWIMNDILYWSGLNPSQINTQSMIDAAAKCEQQISYTSIFGNVTNTLPILRSGGGTKPYAKYDVSLALRQRRSAADVLKGLRMNCGTILAPNYDDGSYYFLVKETLASQQPSAVLLNGNYASNYNTPIASVLVDGTAANGFVAYDFDETNILRKENGETTLTSVATQVGTVPNALSLSFQDAENRYQWDNLTLVCDDDYESTGQQVVGTLQGDGYNTFDRARRSGELMFAETLRGNPRMSIDGQAIGDTKGTYTYSWECSFRGIHLKPGQIVRLNYQQLGIVNWLMRIKSVGIGSNAERLEITATYHNDNWYQNSYGQENSPLFSQDYRSLNQRPPLVWSPGYAAPVTLDTVYDSTEDSFSISQSYAGSGDLGAVAQIQITGQLPQNHVPSSPSAPYVAAQGTTSNTGGTIPGNQTYFLVVCAKSVAGSPFNGPLSAPSQICKVFVPGGTDTNVVSVDVPYWSPGAAGWVLFAGTSLQQLTYQADGDGNPSSIIMTEYNVASWGVPDVKFDHVRLRAKKVLNAGVVVSRISQIGGNSLQLDVPSPGFPSNIFVGYDMSLIASAGNGVETPIANVQISGNNGNTFVFSHDGPMIDSLGAKVGDMVCIRSKPVVGSDSNGNYIQDANWINVTNKKGDSISIIGASFGTYGQIATAHRHGMNNGDWVVVSGVNGLGGLNGLWQVEVVDSVTLALIGSAPTGSYVNGGVVSKIFLGLQTNSLAGMQIRFFAGTGRGTTATIKSNTNNRIYITGQWNVVPDSSSRYWIEEPSWSVLGDTVPISVNSPGQVSAMSLPLQNFDGQVVAIQAVAIDAGGEASNDSYAPIRDLYIYGGQSSGADQGTTAAPSYVLTLGRGSFNVGQIGFSPSVNLFSLEKLQLIVLYWDLTIPATAALTAAMNSSQTTLTYSDANGMVLFDDEQRWRLISVGENKYKLQNTTSNLIIAGSLSNSGFETGDLTAWTIAGGNAYVGPTSRTGNYGLVLGLSGVQSWVYQERDDFFVGQSVTVTTWVKSNTPGATASLYIHDTGSATQISAVTTTTDWQKISATITTATGKLRVHLVQPADVARCTYWDDVDVDYNPSVRLDVDQDFEDRSTWKLIPASTGQYVYIQQVESGLFLGASHSTTDGQQILLQIAADDSQLWQIQSQLDGTCKIVNKYSGLCLAASAAPVGSYLVQTALKNGRTGSVLQIDHELMVVLAVDRSTKTVTVARGQFGSSATSHASGADVLKIQSKNFEMDFPLGFFQTAQSQNFSEDFILPNARIVASQLFGTNQAGNSAATTQNYSSAGPSGFGLETGSYVSTVASMMTQIDGPIAIDDGVGLRSAPWLYYPHNVVVTNITATVGTAPQGSAIMISMKELETGSTIASLSIAAGATSGSVSGSWSLTPGHNILTNITQVGSVSPGADLKITVTFTIGG